VSPNAIKNNGFPRGIPPKWQKYKHNKGFSSYVSPNAIKTKVYLYIYIYIYKENN